MKEIITKYLRGDKIIWVIVILLSIFSLLAVYTSISQRNGVPEKALAKQFVFVVVGILVIYATHKVKYIYFSRLSQILIVFVVPLLVITLAIGRKDRWIDFPGLSFQTSDLAKLALVMFVARILAKRQDKMQEQSTFWLVMAPTIICCGLILPGNLSTAFLLFFVIFMLMFFAKIRGKYLMQIVGCGLLAAVLLLGVVFFGKDKQLPFRMNTWANRVERFINPDAEGAEMTQPDEAKVAIAGSAIIGKMPGNSGQRNFLREANCDFIFAIIVEEYGFIGGFFIVMFYLWFLYRSISIALRCEKSFGSYLVLGLSLLIVFQAMINIFVATGLMPVTGQPLPLVSSGGTALLFTCIGIGIILSVSADNKEKPLHTDPELNEIGGEL